MREIGTILGLEVIGVADGRAVGRVTQVVYDLTTGEVVGLITGQGAAERGVAAADVVTVGEDAVMVPSFDAAKRLSEMPDLMERRREVGAPALDVITDDGRRLGRLARVWVDPLNLKVTSYEVSAGVLRDLAEGPITLPVVAGSVHGQDTLVIPAAEIVGLVGQAGGLKSQLQQLSQRVKQQSTAARGRAQEATKSARERLEKAVASAKDQGTAARGKAEEAAKAARERVGKAVETARERTTDLVQQTTERVRGAGPAEEPAEEKPSEEAPTAEEAAPAEAPPAEVAAPAAGGEEAVEEEGGPAEVPPAEGPEEPGEQPPTPEPEPAPEPEPQAEAPGEGQAEGQAEGEAGKEEGSQGVSWL